MSTIGLESIDHTVQLTHQWISELDQRLGWEDKHRRDWLPVNEAASFGAQLPELLRGVYYEHWRPAATPVKPRHKADFIARIADAFKVDPFFVSEDAVAIVFELLTDKLTRGEIENVRHALPADIRAIWPLPSQAA